MSKKLGILTFHRADNFGAVLQNYALQQAIISLCVSPETIDYHSKRIDEAYRVFRKPTCKESFSRKFKNRIWDIINLKNAYISKMRFENFRKQYLAISSSEYSVNNISDSDFDIYLSGSDQIWNKEIIGEEDESVFSLSFTNQKKATYAASCGNVNCLIDKTDALKEINIISVRELELSIFLGEKGICSVVVLDPVFLLDKEQWNALIKDIPIRKNKYVFLYYIDSGRDVAALIANKISHELGLQVYYPKRYDKTSIKNHYGISSFSDGPLEFIAEIANAEFVVVSSFHGAAFSIIMEKEFVAVLHEKTGERVKNLLVELGLEDRIVTDSDDFERRRHTFKKIDYKLVKERIDLMKGKSLECLSQICDL